MPPTSQIAFTNERHSQQQPRRTPRSPNAFILFRSDFLKRKAVPPEIERRQQNLSRIAGQCWNTLSEAEKATWYSKAAAIREEYRARCPPQSTPFYKDTKPRSSSGRSRSRQTHTPYCTGMFAALYDPNFSSPASQANLVPPTPTSESPLSTTTSASPPSLSYPSPASASRTFPTSQGSPPVISTNSTRNEFSDLLELLSGEIPQGGPSVGPFQEPYPTLRYEHIFAIRAPFPCLEQLQTLHSDPVSQSPTSQLPPTLSQTNTSSPAGHLGDCHALANSFGVTDNTVPFNQSLIPLYPYHS